MVTSYSPTRNGCSAKASYFPAADDPMHLHSSTHATISQPKYAQRFDGQLSGIAQALEHYGADAKQEMLEAQVVLGKAAMTGDVHAFANAVATARRARLSESEIKQYEECFVEISRQKAQAPEIALAAKRQIDYGDRSAMVGETYRAHPDDDTFALIEMSRANQRKMLQTSYEFSPKSILRANEERLDPSKGAALLDEAVQKIVDVESLLQASEEEKMMLKRTKVEQDEKLNLAEKQLKILQLAEAQTANVVRENMYLSRRVLELETRQERQERLRADAVRHEPQRDSRQTEAAVQGLALKALIDAERSSRFSGSGVRVGRGV